MTRLSTVRLGAGILALAGGAASMADSLNLSSGAALGPNTGIARIEGRFFDQTEAESYGFFELRLGGEGSELFLRGTSSDPQNFARSGVALRTGGTELEVGFKRSIGWVPGLTYSLGASFLSTPAQSNPGVAYAISYGRVLGGFNAAVGLKGYANSEASTAAYGFSLGRQFGPSAYIVGDVFVPFNGRNTRSIATGAAESEPVWSGMIAFQPGGGLSDYLVYVFASNSLGSSTAMSLSASLDNQVAFGGGIMVKF